MENTGHEKEKDFEKSWCETLQGLREMGQAINAWAVQIKACWRYIEIPYGLKRVTVQEFDVEKDRDGRANGFFTESLLTGFFLDRLSGMKEEE
jgi:hypothetical protein